MKVKYVKTSLLLVVTLVCVVSCTKKTSNNTVNGHEFVDLGLSVMWATCNIGADSPSDYGDYFAWGETEPKSEYTEENSITYGKSIGSIAGNPEYDAATTNWGGTWRMPSKGEIDELIDRCEHTWTTQDGVKGYKVTGSNGNSIFLPAAGWRDGTSLNYAGGYGDYWSATPYEGDTINSYYLFFDSGDFGRYRNDYRYNGQPVRPVISSTTSISEPSDYINGYGYVDLGLSVMWATCNVGADSPSDYGDYFAWGETEPKSEYTEENSVTNEKRIGSIAGDPQYDAATANWGGTWRMPTTYEIDELIDKCTWKRTMQDGVEGFKITGPNKNSIFLPAVDLRDKISFEDVDMGSVYWSASPFWSDTSKAYALYFYNNNFNEFWNFHRYYGQMVRPVISSTTIISEPTDYINGYGYVDLGLSVKWSTCNVGADSPSDYGNYYAWGETKTKWIYTSLNSVTYWKRRMGSIAGDSLYDAARANWGGTWRLPTADEIMELIDNCQHTWITYRGKKGFKVTGPNGNSIFLPAAGFRENMLFRERSGKEGRYWSATPDESEAGYAYNLHFNDSRFYRYWSNRYRYYGQTVRPVSE